MERTLALSYTPKSLCGLLCRRQLRVRSALFERTVPRTALARSSQSTSSTHRSAGRLLHLAPRGDYLWTAVTRASSRPRVDCCESLAVVLLDKDLLELTRDHVDDHCSVQLALALVDRSWLERC